MGTISAALSLITGALEADQSALDGDGQLWRQQYA